MKRISKILIANRGEIVLRVIRTARRLGIRTVAVYSENDKNSLHVSSADEAWCIGGSELHESYLNIRKILEVALQAGCDAIHPGYGFLAENPSFAEACEKAGIIFIGPSGAVMHKMGNKIEARAIAKKCGIPITGGITGNKKELSKAGKKIGFPLLLKAASGGGGKGMLRVSNDRELEMAIESTARQAQAYFGDGTVYIEKFIDNPRHIEFQVLGDQSGQVIHLFERECTIQRRYQKIIEESPSPTLTPGLRAEMAHAAVTIAKEIGYTNAGTIEFLVDNEMNFYFLEMNTRIQVEHPVTELVTGYDIVEEQIRIAEGNPVRIRQEDVQQRGHAIECRIYAEDPEHDFRPSPGRMTLYLPPEIPGIRLDTGIAKATEILASFDPMISKLIVCSDNREEARFSMIRALKGYIIQGIQTNIPFLIQLLQRPEFILNHLTTNFCDLHASDILDEIRVAKEKIPAFLPLTGFLLADLQRNETDRSRPLIWTEIGYWRNLMKIGISTEYGEKFITIHKSRDPFYTFETDGRLLEIHRTQADNGSISFILQDKPYTVYYSEDPGGQGYLTSEGSIFRMKRADRLMDSGHEKGADRLTDGKQYIIAPMPGKVIRINVKEGDVVRKGDLLLILEAMKMENRVVAPAMARIGKINVAENDRIESSMHLMILERYEEELKNNGDEQGS